MASLNLLKIQNTIVPLAADDMEVIAGLKAGAVIHCEFKKVRNPKFHRQFFALLNMAYDYWNPTGGLIPESEMRGIQGLAKYLGKVAGGEVIVEAAREYARSLLKSRAGKFESVEKDFEAFRRWAIIESGFYELKQSPSGITKIPASISFARMDEAEFDGLYKAVFNTLWRFVLSGVFKDEQEAEHAVSQLLGFS